MNFSRAVLPTVIVVFMLVASCATETRRPDFPSAALPFSPPSDLRTSLYKPDGRGPFPAMVLLHSCAGLRRSVFDWAGRLTLDGYVVLVVDSNSPRGAQDNCGIHKVAMVWEVTDDAFAALAHLRSLPFVDGNRVGVMGFSYGAMAALRTASASYVKRRFRAAGFQAVVAFYPGCTGYHSNPQVHENLNNLYDDINTPLLMLLGELDDETPPGTCVDKAKPLRDRGLPVFWKVYPGTTHAFDLAHLGNRTLIREVPGRGKFTYRYNPEATEDAWKEASAFLGQHVKRR